MKAELHLRSVAVWLRKVGTAAVLDIIHIMDHVEDCVFITHLRAGQ